MKIYKVFVLLSGIVCLSTSAFACIPEFHPDKKVVNSLMELRKFTQGMTKEQQFNGQKGIMVFGAATARKMNPMIKGRSKMAAKSNITAYFKLTGNSTNVGAYVVKSCGATMGGKFLWITKMFVPFKSNSN